MVCVFAGVFVPPRCHHELTDVGNRKLISAPNIAPGTGAPCGLADSARVEGKHYIVDQEDVAGRPS